MSGIILGGNMALIIVGGVLLGLGQMTRGKALDNANQQVYNAIVPDIVGNIFENVQIDPVPHLLDVKDTNIPLPSHSYCSGGGYIRGTYHGLTAELCTVKLTDVNEFQREETGLWEKNERGKRYNRDKVRKTDVNAVIYRVFLILSLFLYQYVLFLI